MDDELTDPPARSPSDEPTDVEVYEPGLPVSSVVRGALTRFLPASLVSMGIGFYLVGGPPSSSLLQALGLLLMFSGAMTVGFGLGLEGLRRWLYPEAQIEGRRSVIAGLMSPLAAFIVAVTWPAGLGTVSTFFVLAIIAVVLAVAMFFAWLTPPEETADPGQLEPVDDLLDA